MICQRDGSFIKELVKIKLKKYGEVNIKISELKKWLVEHSILPDDDNEPFVLKHESASNNMFAPISNVNDEENENEDDDDGDAEMESQSAIYFRFIITAKSLLKQEINCDLVCTDATYKLIW